MYLTIAILGALFFLALFSQFGSRLLAKHALIWWGVGLVIVGAALWPELPQHAAELLGVKLGSNLIFAGLILLLIFILVEQSVELTQHHRLLREVVSKDAARAYSESSAPPWADR